MGTVKIPHDPVGEGSTRAAQQLGRPRGQGQRLEGERGEPAEHRPGLNPELEDALLTVEYERMMSGSILQRSFWTTEDAVALMAEGPPVEYERESERVHAEWFPGRRRFASAVLS